MQKWGPLKLLTLVRGALKKITTDFPLKIEFTCFSMGLTRNFHGKKGGPLNFFFVVWRGPRKNFAINIFCIRPPLTSVCEQFLMDTNPKSDNQWHDGGGQLGDYAGFLLQNQMGFLPNLLVKIIVRTDSKQAATIFFFLGCPVKQAWPSNCLPKVAQITKHMC